MPYYESMFGGGTKETLLATITATTETQYNLSDSLANYRLVLLAIVPASNNRQVLASTIFPASQFGTYSMQADYQGNYNTFCKKNSDTQITGSVKTSGQIGLLYGIN